MALRGRKTAFVEHYLTCWNASEAARLAGYSERTAGQQGHRLLHEPAVRAAIEARLESLAMGAHEVIARLSDQAAASMADFITITEGVLTLDLKKAQERGKLHLIKKLIYDKDGSLRSVELHDSQSALVQVGRYHKLFTDRVEVDDWRKEAEAAGVNVAELFEELVNRLATDLADSAGSDDAGGMGGG